MSFHAFGALRAQGANHDWRSPTLVDTDPSLGACFIITRAKVDSHRLVTVAAVPLALTKAHTLMVPAFTDAFTLATSLCANVRVFKAPQGQRARSRVVQCRVTALA